MKQMTFKTKRSNSMIGKTDAKKKQVHGEPSPDEAPALATKRLPVVHTVDEHSAAERKATNPSRGEGAFTC